MAHQVAVGGHRLGFGATLRTDRWWVGPLLTLLGLCGFIVYATWAAFQGAYYFTIRIFRPSILRRCSSTLRPRAPLRSTIRGSGHGPPGGHVGFRRLPRS